MAFLLPFLTYLLLFSGAIAASLDNVDESYTFEQFSIDFGKEYSPNEVAHRRTIFEKNLHRILTHNANVNEGHVLGINEFTDLESHEIPRGYDKGYHPLWNGAGVVDDSFLSKHELELPFDIDDVSTLPESVDWRAHGVVGPVKSQGSCGSCWTFASASVLESHIALQTGVLFTLSVQELVSCVENPRSCGGDGGCSGATAALAMDFVASSGIQQEWQMGYTAFSGDSDLKCPLRNNTSLRGATGRPLLGRPVATIDGYSSLPTNNYKATMNALAKTGPLAVAVACSNWHSYKGGVFSETHKNSDSFDLNHAVVLMGYGTDSETGEDYWLIQNSWGPLWGEDGYIRLKRVDPETLDDPDSDCGMDVTPSYGEGCTKDKDGHKITPPAVKVCGTSGVLFDPVMPIGGKLV